MKKILIIAFGICICWACSKRQSEFVMTFEMDIDQSAKKDFNEF